MIALLCLSSKLLEITQIYPILAQSYNTWNFPETRVKFSVEMNHALYLTQTLLSWYSPWQEIMIMALASAY